jgi:hypothetical protein
MQILYAGFSQQSNIRCYHFQGATPGERPSVPAQTMEFCLNADISLLAKFGIQIQDGPALCLRILSSGLEAGAVNARRFASYAVTAKDLAAFAEERDAVMRAKTARRRPRPKFKPSPSSQLKWPQVRG